MNDTITTTPQLDWLLSTPVASFEYMIYARREGMSFPDANNKPAHIAGRRSTIVQPIVCADGTTISVQAGEGHYCSPRNNDGFWDAVEVGYPSVDPGAAIREYQEGEDDPTQSVYGYVPVELVREFINAHGGERQ